MLDNMERSIAYGVKVRDTYKNYVDVADAGTIEMNLSN